MNCAIQLVYACTLYTGLYGWIYDQMVHMYKLWSICPILLLSKIPVT